jgi:hypothetical protein
MLEPTDRTFFPPGLANAFRGAASADPGVKPPKPCRSAGAPVGVDRETWSEGVVHVSTGVGSVSAGFGDARAAGTIPGGCNPRGVAVRQAPEPGPVQGDRVELYDLFFNAPSSSLCGTEGEVSATPIGRVADCGFLVELLVGGSSGRPCPVR